MLIKLIQESAEKTFLDALEALHQKAASRSVLLCRFSKTSLRVTADTALSILKDILLDYDGELYFCDDGDVAICWREKTKEVKSALINAFLARYPSELELVAPDKLFQFFDTNAQGEDLRLLFRSKLNPHQKKIEETKAIHVSTKAPAVWHPTFSDSELSEMKKYLPERAKLRAPTILVVEDQNFSRSLLMGLLRNKYICYEASNGKEAVALYAEHIPSIVFLDIELPDIDGHTLAAFFKKHDPQSHIVMVTGNSHVNDVEAAKANKVQGFIVKPYNKLKIMGAVDTFIARKKGS